MPLTEAQTLERDELTRQFYHNRLKFNDVFDCDVLPIRLFGLKRPQGGEYVYDNPPLLSRSVLEDTTESARNAKARRRRGVVAVAIVKTVLHFADDIDSGKTMGKEIFISIFGGDAVVGDTFEGVWKRTLSPQPWPSPQSEGETTEAFHRRAARTLLVAAIQQLGLVDAGEVVAVACAIRDILPVGDFEYAAATFVDLQAELLNKIVILEDGKPSDKQKCIVCDKIVTQENMSDHICTHEGVLPVDTKTRARHELGHNSIRCLFCPKQSASTRHLPSHLSTCIQNSLAVLVSKKEYERGSLARLQPFLDDNNLTLDYTKTELRKLRFQTNDTVKLIDKNGVRFVSPLLGKVFHRPSSSILANHPAHKIIHLVDRYSDVVDALDGSGFSLHDTEDEFRDGIVKEEKHTLFKPRVICDTCCKVHDSTNLNNLLNQGFTPICCTGKIPLSSLTLADLKARLRKIFGSRLTIHVRGSGSKTKDWQIRCSRHGTTFFISWGNLMSGHNGCPRCQDKGITERQFCNAIVELLEELLASRMPGKKVRVEVQVAPGQRKGPPGIRGGVTSYDVFISVFIDGVLALFVIVEVDGAQHVLFFKKFGGKNTPLHDVAKERYFFSPDFSDATVPRLFIRLYQPKLKTVPDDDLLTPSVIASKFVEKNKEAISFVVDSIAQKLSGGGSSSESGNDIRLWPHNSYYVEDSLYALYRSEENNPFQADWAAAARHQGKRKLDEGGGEDDSEESEEEWESEGESERESESESEDEDTLCVVCP